MSIPASGLQKDKGLLVLSVFSSHRERATEANPRWKHLPTADSSAPFLSGGPVGAGEGGEPANRRSDLYRVGSSISTPRFCSSLATTAELVDPGVAPVTELLLRRIKVLSDFEDGYSVFPGKEFLRFVCLFFGSAESLLWVPQLDFGWMGALVILGRLFLCFVSAKGCELPVIPVVGCGFRPPVAVSGGGGPVRRISTEMMPMVFQRFRCGLEGSESLIFAALHVLVVFVVSSRARRWPAASGGCCGRSGAAPGWLGKSLEEEKFCKEVLVVLFCNFLFFPGYLGMYSSL